MLSAENITCGYRERLVLNELSIAIEQGELFMILGPNGSGKTTLLRVLANLLSPKFGVVTVNGDAINSLSSSLRARRIAVAPQTESRDRPLTVEEAVALGRAPHRGWLLPLTREDHAEINDALKRTGLMKLRSRPITEISGGEWRRMVLARTLAQRASILLLDEPTAGLDLKYQFEVLDIAAELAHSRRLTVVAAIHDINAAAIYADRLLMLNNQSIAAIGAPREVITAETIASVFGIQATVVNHPIYNTPLVAPVRQSEQQ